MKKLFKIILFLLINAQCILLQAQKSDTIKLNIQDVIFCEGPHHLSLNMGKYSYDGNYITKEAFDSLRNLFKTICDSTILRGADHYCQFIDNNGQIIEEGNWQVEFFSGYYKKYYPNGKLEEEGNYTEYSEKPGAIEPGQKTGKWIYYLESGEIKKIIDHKPK